MASVSPDQTPMWAGSGGQSRQGSSRGSNKDKAHNQNSPKNAQSKKHFKSLLLKVSKREGEEPSLASRDDLIDEGRDEGAGTNEDSKIGAGEGKPE